MKWWSSLISVALILSFIACSTESESRRSEKIIDSRKMAEVIADVQLAESISKVTADGLRINTDSVNAYQSIFDYHQLSTDQFKLSMEYYSMIPDTLEMIYELTLEVLSEKQASMEAVKQD